MRPTYEHAAARFLSEPAEQTSYSLPTPFLGPPRPGRLIVRIERLLWRPQLDWNVLEIDAHTRPRRVAAAHRVDEHVRRSQMRGGFWMTGAPALESRERVFFLLRAPDFD
jgi:hypothetical protein